MRIRHLSILGFSLCLMLSLSSCGNIDKFDYFQDINPKSSVNGIEVSSQPRHLITFEPGDRLSIVVSSKNASMATMFNLTTNSTRGGEAGTTVGQQSMSLYTIDSEGNIDFPILGKIHVAGMTREQVSSTIKDLLTTKEMLPDPVVTVEYSNLCYYMIGEAGSGRQSIDREDLTIVDAIAKVGGMSNYGLRDSVMVIRTGEDGVKRAYNLDFTKWNEVTNSPVYYVKQNDLIYVKPNNTKKRQSTTNGSTVFTTSFWMSLASLATTIAVLFTR